MDQTPMEKCSYYKRDGDICEITCKLGLWSVAGPFSLALINEATHYFEQYRDGGEYDELLTQTSEEE